MQLLQVRKRKMKKNIESLRRNHHIYIVKSVCQNVNIPFKQMTENHIAKPATLSLPKGQVQPGIITWCRRQHLSPGPSYPCPHPPPSASKFFSPPDETHLPLPMTFTLLLPLFPYPYQRISLCPYPLLPLEPHLTHVLPESRHRTTVNFALQRMIYSVVRAVMGCWNSFPLLWHRTCFI